MPQGKQSQDTSKKDPRKVGRDLAASPDDFVAEADAQEKGYWGTRPNVFDDKEFALTTGPNSPGVRDLDLPDD